MAKRARMLAPAPSPSPMTCLILSWSSTVTRSSPTCRLINLIENRFQINKKIEVADLLHRGEFPFLDLAGARLVSRQVHVHHHDALLDLLEGVVADEFLEGEKRGAV